MVRTHRGEVLQGRIARGIARETVQQCAHIRAVDLHVVNIAGVAREHE